MSPSPVLPPGLDELLQALREVGLPVGAREVLRLHGVFALRPALDAEDETEDQLRHLLEAVLVHSPEERGLFEPIYREWRGRWRQWEEAGRGDQETPRERQAIEGPPPQLVKRPRHSLLLAAAVLGVLTLALAFLLIDGPAGQEGKEEQQEQQQEKVFVDDFRVLQRDPPTEKLDVWVPKIVRQDQGLASSTKPPPSLVMILGAGLLLLCGGMLSEMENSASLRRPPQNSPPTLPGPRRVPYLPLPKTAFEFLDADGARTLVWGVGRHQTENLTSEIDLERSAYAIACAGGLPDLRYVPEKRLREVWLWLDGLVDDPALARYAEEIAASLEENGLAVRIGAFDGYPEVLLWDEGQLFRPGELEGHRQKALVAVMTDGELLQRVADRRDVVSLLGALAAWERLTFVDFSDHRKLAGIVEPYGIPCVSPQVLPDFFGLGVVQKPVRESTDPAKLRLWRSALKLGPRAVERTDAFALRDALHLNVSPWAIRRLAAEGTRGVHLNLGDEHAQDLHWLRDSGEVEEGALAFWEWRLEEEDRRRLARGDLEGWAERPGRRYLAMERALLKLRRDPEVASEELESLAAQDEALAVEIGMRLKVCGDAGTNDRRRIPLPWTLRELPGTVRQRLGKLGFRIGEGKLESSGRQVLGVGLLIGISLGFLLGSGDSLDEPDPATQSPLEIDCGDVPEGAFCEKIDGWVFAGTPWSIRSEMTIARPQTDARVTWEKHLQQDCVPSRRTEQLEAQIWRCPRETTIRFAMPSPWPRRRLAVVELSMEDPQVWNFARTLLDSGSIDALVVGRDAEQRLVELTGSVGSWQREDELLWFVASGAGVPDLTSRFLGKAVVLEVEDVLGLETRFQELVRPTRADQLAKLRAGDGSLLLNYCPALEGEHKSGMRFVWVCGGRLRMGSDESGDEKPVHDVDLTGFWIGKHEVTKGGGQMPVNRISWTEARQSCQGLGPKGLYDLPREEQWEYVLRGNTERVAIWISEAGHLIVSFGERSTALPDERASELVGVRGAGASRYGALHPAGNLVEWVRDKPWEQRSLISLEPLMKDVSIGFRCVREPRRQP